MKAIIQEKYGLPEEVLQLQEVDKPHVAENEVLIRVKAASMHADIWHVITGRPYMMRLISAALHKPKHPIPGTDMSGIVQAIGKNVTQFKAEDEVFGESHNGLQWHNGGAYAEYVSAPQDAIAIKPDNVSFEQAAAVPTSGYIVIANLQQSGEITPGKRVLINGAGGGVGSIALQIAKAHGAHVTAVDNGKKLEMLSSLGADKVIDYTKQDFTKNTEQYDLVFDVASVLSLSDCKRVLTSDGIYIIIGHDHYGEKGGKIFGNLPHFFKLMARAPFDKHLPPLNFSIPAKQDVMSSLKEYMEAGQLTPIIDRSYPLSEISRAIQYMKTGEALGKIIIVP